MGREIRMVPPNWQHPKNERGHLQPMFDEHIDEAVANWLADFDRVRRGELKEWEEECFKGEGKNTLAKWLSDNGPPDPAYHRPWKDGEATWFQVWETVSEGTPVSPPFASREELVAYLVEGGDDWDRKRGRGGYTRAEAEAFVELGSAPTAVVTISASGACSTLAGIASSVHMAGKEGN